MEEALRSPSEGPPGDLLPEAEIQGSIKGNRNTLVCSYELLV